MKKIVFALLAMHIMSIAGFSQSQNLATKLFRFGAPGNERPGVILPDGKMLDVSAFGEDYNETFFEKNGIARLSQWLATNAEKCRQVPGNVRMAPCVTRPSKIVGIGLNYTAHAAEADIPVPKEPVIFLKSTTSLCGANDNVIIPDNSVKTDWEAELAVIIGKKASHVTEENALQYVAGYAVVNDYSERAWQLESPGQWTKGKSADTFCPLGPWLVTPEAVGDPQNLKVWLKVNGKTMQESNTSDMVFKIKTLVSSVSRHMTLLPGDVIATGTPAGVGLGQKPPVFLKPGDVVELGIEKLGTQKQTAISFIQSQLTAAEYQDYEAWVALGVGGIPHTLEGYRMVKRLGSMMKDPLDAGRVAGDIGKSGDLRALEKLPKRKGTKPTIAPFAVPHRQTDQHNNEAIRKLQQQIFDDMAASKEYALEYKMSYLERNNPGLFLRDSTASNPTVVPVSHGEVGHIHHFDGSMHIILSPSDTKTVIEAGWGELHGLAGDGRAAKTYMMIYSPRDKNELAITQKILEAAVKYASTIPMKSN